MCQCIDTVDATLAERNTRLVRLVTLTSGARPPRVMLETEKVVTRAKGKAQRVTATHCPFCGIRYDPRS